MIFMNDFKAEPAQLRVAMLKAAERVIESGWYVLGNEVEKFEKKWSDVCGVPYGIGVGNGMDAIEIALRALDIGPGDEVITTPMTAFATVLAILRAGATPVLADIDAETALLSIESVERCLTNKTKAVLLVHLYGQIRQMQSWQYFCQEKNIHLLEDCAQAHLATAAGKVAGSFGVAGAYSFYPTKNLGALGDAGMLVTANAKVAERASQLRNYGQSVRYYHPELGMNSRLDELHAAMLGEKLEWLVSFTERRRNIAAAYRQEIVHPLVKHLAPPEERSAHAYHLFVVICPERDALQLHLQNNQIQALIHYPIPIQQQEPCYQIKRDIRGLPVSEKHAVECLSLPCHPQMSDADVEQVIHIVNTFKAQ
jgi:dTDP-4-amino-4,6-dideoxygalactose transaminase